MEQKQISLDTYTVSGEMFEEELLKRALFAAVILLKERPAKEFKVTLEGQLFSLTIDGKEEMSGMLGMMPNTPVGHA